MSAPQSLPGYSPPTILTLPLDILLSLLHVVASDSLDSLHALTISHRLFHTIYTTHFLSLLSTFACAFIPRPYRAPCRILAALPRLRRTESAIHPAVLFTDPAYPNALQCLPPLPPFDPPEFAQNYADETGNEDGVTYFLYKIKQWEESETASGFDRNDNALICLKELKRMIITHVCVRTLFSIIRDADLQMRFHPSGLPIQRVGLSVPSQEQDTEEAGLTDEIGLLDIYRIFTLTHPLFAYSAGYNVWGNTPDSLRPPTGFLRGLGYEHLNSPMVEGTARPAWSRVRARIWFYMYSDLGLAARLHGEKEEVVEFMQDVALEVCEHGGIEDIVILYGMDREQKKAWLRGILGKRRVECVWEEY